MENNQQLLLKQEKKNEEYDNYIRQIIKNENIDFIKNNIDKILKIQQEVFLLEKKLLENIKAL